MSPSAISFCIDLKKAALQYYSRYKVQPIMTNSDHNPSQSISNAVRDRLRSMAETDKKDGIRTKFKSQPSRLAESSFDIDGFHIDFSKSHFSVELLEIYKSFAQEIDFPIKRESFLAGAKINSSEDRSVLHTLLRDADNQGIAMERPETLDQARDSKRQFLTQYQSIREQLDKRASPITDIIHVGIGGSSLGTQLVFEALSAFDERVNIHFIGNIDAHQLVSVLAKCDADTTLVIGVSKTFTTAETLQNLNSIADWFTRNGVKSPLENFYGVTAAPTKAHDYGISESNVVSFPQWVGGRYSVWSSVSLSAALVFGIDKFEEFLSGAAAVDRHFYKADLSTNLCFIAASLDHYYSNFMGAQSRAIFAYDYRLRSLVDYLQQLETESNGKDRQISGAPVDQATSAVVWGGVGTDVQHSVFQMLHQGTSLIPAEFILVKNADHDLQEHHTELLANGIAQTAALLAGQDYKTVSEVHADEELSELTKQAKIFSGDRPSTTILLERLTPATLGALLAFYEHRTFCGGILCNINSYDQMGVELGKRLAKQVKPMLEAGARPKSQPQKSAEEFDPSTLALVSRVLAD